ncbi:MAG: OB-fold domain-containing protein [Proteobacteria bacterium]|nr:OB-fold domain-containing protein [Pseudomonadota bacterium]
MSVGITAYGGYVPRLRLSRQAVVDANAWFAPGLKAYAKGERAICNWDEDALTLAVEAARDCLAGEVPADLGALYFASTTHPFADRQNAGVLATALQLGETLATSDMTGSQRAGTSGLLTALRSLQGQGGSALYVASEDRKTKSSGTAELLYGAGAAALLLGTVTPIAEFVGGHQIAVDFVDHYRAQNEAFDYSWEERWVRDEGYAKIVPQALAGLFAAVNVTPAEIDHFVMPCVLRGVPQKIAAQSGIPEAAVRDNLHAGLGETGTAHALVMLVHALEQAKPGETILVIGWGQGCDALLFRTTDALTKLPARPGISGALARRKEETNYNKFLAFNNLIVRELGMRAETDKQTPLTTLYRNKEMLTALVGGKCGKCGTVQFPKSNVCVNPNCGEFHSQEDYPFADRGAKVVTWTADNLTFSADPPAHYGIVQFDEGGRFMAEFTDVDVGKVEVGLPMRMMFRIKEHDTDRGFKKYFWKAAPQFSG